jgi:hypothetical protein
MALSKDQILATKGRLKTERVKVPEWATDGDDEVIVRELNARELDEWQESMQTRQLDGDPADKKAQRRLIVVPDTRNANAKLAARTLVNEKGERLFTDAEVVELGELSSQALIRVVEVAMRLCGLTDEDIDDAEGNSAASAGGASSLN